MHKEDAFDKYSPVVRDAQTGAESTDTLMAIRMLMSEEGRAELDRDLAQFVQDNRPRARLAQHLPRPLARYV